MQNRPNLIFTLNGSRYGIDATIVREIFALPELISIAEAPIDILGILNFRSQIVPVMHLALRLGLPMSKCSLDNSVIILEWQKLLIGLIVDRVQEIQNLNERVITNQIDYGRVRDIKAPLIAGVAEVEPDTIILLDPENLIRYPDQVNSLIGGKNEVVKTELENSFNYDNFYQLFFPNANEEKRKILRQRANNLKQSLATHNRGQLIPLAVVGLNNEYFGVDVDLISEFIDLVEFTPIPCCPNHIIGNLNLRGEIITLVDIRQFLNLANQSNLTSKKIVVIKLKELVVGITVDEVLDVIHLNSSEIKANSIQEQNYLQGTLTYQQKLLGIIDLKTLITQPALVVNH